MIPILWAADAQGNTSFCRGTQNLHNFTLVLAPPASSWFALLSSSSSRIRCGFVYSGSYFNSHFVTYFLNLHSLTFELLACGFFEVFLGYEGVLVLGKVVNQLSHPASIRCMKPPTVLDSFTILGCKILCECLGCGVFKVVIRLFRSLL